MERLRAKNPVLSIRADLQEWLTVMAQRLRWLTPGRKPVRTSSGGIGSNVEPRPAVSAIVQASLAFVATIDRDGHRGVVSSEDALRIGLAEIRARESEDGSDGRTCVRILKDVDS
jgi:hypothetical protein